MNAKFSVLIVDDDPILRAIAGEILRAHGYECAEAEDGAVAMHYLKRAKADLVIVDMLMPNKDGIETVMEIKQAFPATRIIAISGGARAMEPDQLLRMAAIVGADATMLKPLHKPAFVALVGRVLGHGRIQAA